MKQRILFICHGNICRSTMAEFVMKHLVKQAGREDEFEIASAATSREEIGHDTHYGTKEKLREKGVPKELWDDALEELPDPAEAIDAFLRAKLRGELDQREKKRLSDALLRRGFAWPDVKAGLNRLGAELYEE